MKKSKSTLNWFDKLLLVINCGLCLTLLIGYLAPFADPRKFWVIAFFGLAYPPVLFANVLMVAWWLLRKSKWALLSIITILIGWNVFLNNVGFSLSGSVSVAPGLNIVRVLSYNVHNFKRYGSEKETTTRHDMLALIKSEYPDVINIQEFYTRRVGKYAMIDSIKNILGEGYGYFEQFNGNKTDLTGMAIFSRWPIIATGVIKLSDVYRSENQCLYVDVKKNGRIFRIYNTHFQSISFRENDYKYLDSVSNITSADMESTRRVGGKLKQAFIKRAAQVIKVKEHTKQCPYPFILSGDFNDTPSSFAVNQIGKGIKNAFREKGLGLGRTYNGDFPNYQIDYIMASPGFDVLSYNIAKKKLSDHYPVCASLKLN